MCVHLLDAVSFLIVWSTPSQQMNVSVDISFNRHFLDA